MPAGCQALLGALLLSTFLVQLGCGSRQDLHFSYTGSDAGFVQAQSAAEEWNTKCGATLLVVRGPGIPLVERGGPIVVAGANMTGLTTVLEDEVQLVEFSAGPQARGVLLHEFGHALGIKNHEAYGLMAHAGRTPSDEQVTDRECYLIGAVVE